MCLGKVLHTLPRASQGSWWMFVPSALSPPKRRTVNNTSCRNSMSVTGGPFFLWVLSKPASQRPYSDFLPTDRWLQHRKSAAFPKPQLPTQPLSSPPSLTYDCSLSCLGASLPPHWWPSCCLLPPQPPRTKLCVTLKGHFTSLGPASHL